MVKRWQDFARKLLFKTSLRVLGVDIGDGYVRLVQTDWHGARPVVEQVAIAPLPDGCMDGGQVIDEYAVTAVLTHMLEAYGFQAHDAIVGVGRKAFFLRAMNMPTASLQKLRHILQFEVAEQVPYAQESYYWDFVVADSGCQQQIVSAETTVLLVASPKTVVDSLCNVVHQAGLEVLAVDCEPLAWCRLMVDCGNTVVVDIGKSFTSIMLFHGQKLLFSRVVNVGRKQLRSGENDTLRDASSFNELLEEVGRTIRYTPQVAVHDTKLYVSGEGAEINGCLQALSEGLNMPGQQFPLQLHLTSQHKLPMSAVQMTQLPVAVGLAFRPQRESWSWK